MTLKVFGATVTQGSADAFAETSITTGLQNVSRLAWRVRRIEMFLTGLPGVDSDITGYFSRKSFAAIPNFYDPAVLVMDVRKAEFTTSGFAVQQTIRTWSFPRDEDMTLVEDPLYLGVDSTSTSASNSCIIRVFYEVKQIGETERLALIAASLAGV